MKTETVQPLSGDRGSTAGTEEAQRVQRKQSGDRQGHMSMLAVILGTVNYCPTLALLELALLELALLELALLEFALLELALLVP